MAPDTTSWRFARATAPAVRVLAGRRWFPLWAVVHHRGRVSGRDLRVPVAVTAAPGLFVINLPWGARTNWVRNVLAAGGCTIRWRGTDHRADQPRILDAAAARPYYSRTTWAIASRLFPADAWLLLRRTPAPHQSAPATAQKALHQSAPATAQKAPHKNAPTTVQKATHQSAQATVQEATHESTPAATHQAAAKE